MSKAVPIEERFDHLRRVISSGRFLRKEGLGNEVPFFIYPYPPQIAVAMESMMGQLTRRLEKDGVRVLAINMYDLAVDLLKARGKWDQILQIEPSLDKGAFKELLEGPLDPEKHLIPAIARKMAEKEHDVIFLSGVGELFPYIRSHTVLNNLQSTATKAPTVMFFPGEYSHSNETGANLNLFGRLPNDRYYRAFNIALFQI